MRARSLPLGRGDRLEPGSPTLVMGILNVTPDSFSDGGELPDVESAVARGRALLAEGADLLDVGGESTRPGAEPVSPEEEARRVVPVVRALVERLGARVSVDTRRALTFTEAWEAGASLLNDVSGLEHDPELGPAAARTEAAVVLMHSRGDPETMDSFARYGDVGTEVEAELEDAVLRARTAGISEERLILDPGLGFAKNAEQSLDLLRDLERCRLGRFPLLVGGSRKRFLGHVTGQEEARGRDLATAVLSGWLAERGVEIVRVHAVRPSVDAIRVHEALAGPLATAGTR